ncbi:MAG: LptE family protein [Gemmatimonadota bacterium]
MIRPGRVLVCAAVVTTAGCMYSFRAGSFPPEHIKTIAIQPFDNETTRFELSGEVYDQLLRNLPRALGIRTAGEEVADAVVRGTIVRYDVRAPNYRAGAEGQPAEVLQRQVTLSVQVEIVDLVENVILWEERSVQAEGQFLEASETEEVGRAEAIELLVQKIVDGAQSNW